MAKKVSFKPRMKVLYNGAEATISKVEQKHLTLNTGEGKVRVYKKDVTVPEPVFKQPAARVEGGKAPPAEVLAAARNRYEITEDKNGKKHIDNGDRVADKLRGMTLEEVYSFVAEEAGEDEKELKKKYGRLNPGMQRMNLGNKYRSHLGMNDDKQPKAKAKKEKRKKNSEKTDEQIEKEQEAEATEE